MTGATRPDIPAGLPEPARDAAYRAYRCWRIGDDGDGRLHAALVAAAPLIRAAERERLAAVIPPERFRSMADWFDADDEFKVTMFPETWPQRGHETQDDLRRFADLLGTGQEPLSAACTGPDCGEQFADSETGEYLFATRDRMERLLHADGWAAGPVLCPACGSA